MVSGNVGVAVLLGAKRAGAGGNRADRVGCEMGVALVAEGKVLEADGAAVGVLGPNVALEAPLHFKHLGAERALLPVLRFHVVRQRLRKREDLRSLGFGCWGVIGFQKLGVTGYQKVRTATAIKAVPLPQVTKR